MYCAHAADLNPGFNTNDQSVAGFQPGGSVVGIVVADT